jgi:hypothetical protein
MGIDGIRNEIGHMRQISRQQKEILQLQRAGIPTTSAEALLERMQAKVDGLVEQRDRLKGEERVGKTYASGKRESMAPRHTGGRDGQPAPVSGALGDGRA